MLSVRRQHHLQGQPHPGELTPGGDAAQGAGVAAGVGTEQQLDVVGTVRAQLVGGQVEEQPGVRHGQRGQLDEHPLTEGGGRPRPLPGDLPGEVGQLTVEGGHALGQRGDPLVGGVEGHQPGGRVRGPGEHLVDARAVLAREALQGRSPAGDPLQAAGLGVQPVEVAREVGGDVTQGVAHLGQPRRQRGDLGVGLALQGLPGDADLGHRPTGLVVASGQGGQGRRGHQAQVVGRLQPLGLGGQRTVLPRLGRDLLDLGQPESQQVGLAGAGERGVTQACQLGGGGSALEEAAAVGHQQLRQARRPRTGPGSPAAGRSPPAAPARTGRGW